MRVVAQWGFMICELFFTVAKGAFKRFLRSRDINKRFHQIIALIKSILRWKSVSSHLHHKLNLFSYFPPTGIIWKITICNSDDSFIAIMNFLFPFSDNRFTIQSHRQQVALLPSIFPRSFNSLNVIMNVYSFLFKKSLLWITLITFWLFNSIITRRRSYNKMRIISL